MIALVFAGLVAVLMASATYLLLQRHPVRLVIGLGLFTHAVNLLVFGTSVSHRGLPPSLWIKTPSPATSAASLTRCRKL